MVQIHYYLNYIYANFIIKIKMYLILVFLPLISSITAGLFGRYLGPKGSSIVTVILLITTFFTSTFIFYEVAIIGCPVYIKLMPWINA